MNRGDERRLSALRRPRLVVPAAPARVARCPSRLGGPRRRRHARAQERADHLRVTDLGGPHQRLRGEVERLRSQLDNTRAQLSQQKAELDKSREALYGARPFRGDDFAALAHAIQHSDPPPPPPGSPVPPWLFPLVLRCLAKDPDRRWPNLADLLAELARDPEAERRRRRRLALQLLATMTLTVLAIVGSVRLYAILARHNAERRADERLAELREQLAQPRVKTTPGEAERLIAAFAAYPDNRGTAAVARAHLERASELADPAAAVDAYAGAFLTATDPVDEIAALRGLIPRLVAAGRHVEAGEALATLDRRAPELAHDPDLALARRTAALRCRNLPAARAALDVLPADDPLRSYAAVLDNLSRATVLDPAQFGGLHHEFHLYTTADLDGDGRPELATATPGRARDSFAIFAGTAGLPLLGRFASGQPALQNVSLLPTGHADGPLLFTAAAIAGKPQLFRYALSEPLQDGSVAERLVFEDAHNLVAAAADLDHDGHPELYLGTGAYTRHLLRADRGPTGAFTLHSPSPSLDRLASDLSALAGGDLDGDGHDELVVAAGPWRAFDLRILRRRADGELVTVARQSLGMLRSLQLVRVGDELWIAAAKQDNYASPTRFSARAPFGPPAGLYLFALRNETLVQTGFHPTADLPGVEHLDFPMLVADLDGDRHDDILVRASDPEAGRSNLVVYRQHAGNFLPPLVIHGIEPRALLEQDDDPSPELLATDSRAGPQETLILGLGDAPLRPLAVPRDAERPVPAGLDEPALAAAWRRTEEMVAIGLPHRSAVELSALAGPAGHVREDLFFRAGELFARAGDHAAAAERFIAAAERPALAAEALAGAIRSRRALGDIAGETALAERRVALPDLAPSRAPPPRPSSRSCAAPSPRARSWPSASTAPSTRAGSSTTRSASPATPRARPCGSAPARPRRSPPCPCATPAAPSSSPSRSRSSSPSGAARSASTSSPATRSSPACSSAAAAAPTTPIFSSAASPTTSPSRARPPARSACATPSTPSSGSPCSPSRSPAGPPCCARTPSTAPSPSA